MGGANHSLLELVEGLRKLGNNVSVAVLYRGCPIDRKLRERGFRTVPCIFGWWQQPEDWPVLMKAMFRLLHWTQKITVRRIVRYVKREHIDIIHSNTSVIDIGAQAAALAGCRHVWHFREYGYGLEYMYGRDKSMTYAYQNSDMIIYISNALYEFYKPYADIHKTRVIYDGIVPENPPVPLHDPLKETPSEEKKPYIFLVTGNISPGKNQKLVVEAAHILISRMGVGKSRFRVYFAGATTSLAESRNYMREIASFIKLHDLDNLVFMGYVENMPELRSRVDAEIVSSQSEAYGRAALEAMLSRNLVLASDCGASPELVGRNERGILFRNNDVNDLARKMLDAMNPDHNECLDRAYEYVIKVHSQKESHRKVHDIYEYITDKKQELQ